MKLRLTLTTDMLGTKPSNINVFADFVASHAPDGDKRKEELETAEHREESGTTVFHRLPGHPEIPIIWDYQLRGFLKSACGALRIADNTLSKKVVAYKSKIDQLIFVTPRIIPIQIPTGGKMGILERSLRADTAQGPRVGLARSETVPAGSVLECDIVALASKIGKGTEAVPTIDLIDEWLRYGQFCGLGQWRNASHGRFNYEIILDSNAGTAKA